ncbi:MAG: hypothetical protein HQK64_13325 [Desulfamplus sp.]|nr:hypothetical protein [Desulfamplus sp.]
MQPTLLIKNSLEAIEPSKTDYSLLLKRLKSSLLHSQEDLDSSSTNAILKKRDVWQKLDPTQMAEWAALCQIAGEVELALEIYSYLAQTYPDFEKGRAEYIELLTLFNKKEGDLSPQLPFSLSSPSAPSAAEAEAASLPFETMIRKKELMELYLNLFSGREDIFARQWADKNENKSGYVPVRYSMALAHVEEHLNGLKTYGIYLLKSDSKVKCGVIDADINPEYRTGKITADQKNTLYREKSWMISRIFEISKQLGIKPLLEYSGHKGRASFS